MKELELVDEKFSVVNQGVELVKDFIKSGDDLNSNVSKNISDISIEYSKIENNGESSKEKIAKHAIDANVKIALGRHLSTVFVIAFICVTSIILNNKKGV